MWFKSESIENIDKRDTIHVLDKFYPKSILNLTDLDKHFKI